MRLARLDLLRYGRFTDASIDLPWAERDIHIIYGPNEAGKTTSLTAIEDLLFGIPLRSPYNFLHNYETMRIGALLKNGDNRLEFQRRKSRRDMIVGPDGGPLPNGERELAPFLGGADRLYFDRMFNLSHDRLAQGGRAIIEAKDDVGQMLFAAGTGLADLRERLVQLDEEADALWSPRKSTQRLYYQGRERLDEARRKLREHSLTVNDWRTARKNASDAESRYQDIQREHNGKSTELKKLARVRRVHGAVRQRNELIPKLDALGDVTELPADAADKLRQAEHRDARIGAQLNLLEPQLQKAQQTLESISFDEALVRRADEITQINERRIAIHAAREDLPKRREEYRLELESLGGLGEEIGWDFKEPSELIERVPSRSKVEPMRKLLERRGELAAELSNKRKALEESQSALRDETERLEEIGEATDVAMLVAVLNVVRDIGDVAARIRNALGSVKEIAGRIENKLLSMKPVLPEGTDIETLKVPPRDSVIAHRDAVRSWEQRQAETKHGLREARNRLESDQEALERRVQCEGIVAPGAVEEARGNRDKLWGLVKARYIARSEISAEESSSHAEPEEDQKALPASLEEAIEIADDIADRRFDKAHAAGELAVLAQNTTGHQTRIRQLEEDEAALEIEPKQLGQAWRALWAEVPVDVVDADVMLAWLEAREEVVALIGRKREENRTADDNRREEQEAIAKLNAALTSVGWNAESAAASELRVLIEQAGTYRREQETKAAKIVELREAVRTAKSEVTRRQGELNRVEEAQENWLVDWGEAATAIGLEHGGKPDVLSAKISVVEEMRERAAAARNLRDNRIAAIERDIETFEITVSEIIAELASDLTGGDADGSVLELDRRRDEALKQYERHQEFRETVAKRQVEIEELKERRSEDWIAVQPLFVASAVDDVEELREAINRSDRFRSIDKTLAEIMTTIEQQGDGLAIEALEDECRDVDIDAIRTKEEAVEEELRVLEEKRERALIAQNEAQRAFEAIGGDDTAASAAADRAEALATMRDATERYVRVKASATLLRWAVDRYRKEKQGPLLKRASELFRMLTRRSFERLEVCFDDRDAMQLTGVRDNGEVVAVQGMSTGTEDQLFLALRLAAVEDYLTRAVALPFVADDLFINFDQERSAAGFEVLAQLAKRTQVLFFTHHLHLVKIAREILGNDMHLVELVDAG